MSEARILWRAGLALFVVVALALVGGADAAAQRPFAPLDQPGPALSPTAAQLRASLFCEPGVKDATVEPVLLNPGTSTTPTENFGWNWEPALEKLGIPWCAYTAPNQTLNRIDISGEYLVYAIRTMYQLAGRQIAIIGHSQGGMSMRWALRFWPDTRAMVADVVGLEASNHGTTVLTASVCELLGCVPADWQQISTSNFIQALNSQAETFAGTSYTNTYSIHDEVATPDTGPNACTSCLSTHRSPPTEIANIELQSICPLDPSEHVLAGTTDPVAYALGIDAITHPGPARAGRIPKSVCSQVLMPGVTSPASLAGGLGALGGAAGSLGILPGPLGTATSGAPVLHREPSLPCYAFAACPPSATLRVTVKPARITPRRRTRLYVLVTVDVAGVVLPVPDATVWVEHRRQLHTDDDGRASVTLGFGNRDRLGVIATDPEYHAGRAYVPVSERSTHPRARHAAQSS
jgi:pimeloyl-ACP methyl ester carboxylesterase